MRTLDDPARLLDLLREAGDEPVSLDELHIVGVVDPARALHLLEDAGHAVQRVIDARTDGPVTCVCLRANPVERPAPSAPSPAPVTAVDVHGDRRPLLLALVALLLVLLVARRP
jgi:hypothetical protein